MRLRAVDGRDGQALCEALGVFRRRHGEFEMEGGETEGERWEMKEERRGLV